MAPNDSVLVIGIQDFGYRAGTPLGVQYKTLVPDVALEA